MTLAEAVAELNALDNPRTILATYPNRPAGPRGARCESCPVALFLHERTNGPVWVSAFARVKAGIWETEEFELHPRFGDIIREFDQTAA